jgi:hypothetical protein
VAVSPQPTIVPARTTTPTAPASVRKTAAQKTSRLIKTSAPLSHYSFPFIGKQKYYITPLRSKARDFSEFFKKFFKREIQVFSGRQAYFLRFRP